MLELRNSGKFIAFSNTLIEDKWMLFIRSNRLGHFPLQNKKTFFWSK